MARDASGSAWARRPPGWEANYVIHVGFVLISFFEGFIIVLTIDLRAPGWLITTLALLVVMVGRNITRRVQARVEA